MGLKQGKFLLDLELKKLLWIRRQYSSIYSIFQKNIQKTIYNYLVETCICKFLNQI